AGPDKKRLPAAADRRCDLLRGSGESGVQPLEGDGHGGAHPHLAVQADAGVVDAGDLLDDGKPQPGAAGGLAAAFVHPVEALQDAALSLFGDADAVVVPREIGVALPGAAGLQQDPAPGPVVADGVVAQVLTERFQQAGGALDLGALAPEVQGDVGPTGVHLQALGALP